MNFEQTQSRAQNRCWGLSIIVIDVNAPKAENLKMIEAEYNGEMLFSIGVDGLVTRGPAWTTEDQASQAFVNMIGLRMSQFLAPFVAAEIMKNTAAKGAVTEPLARKRAILAAADASTLAAENAALIREAARLIIAKWDADTASGIVYGPNEFAVLVRALALETP